MTVEWSEDALADLDRFATFLHETHPSIAAVVARAIKSRTQILSAFPRLGRPVAGRREYRQIVLEVLGAPYVFQYRLDAERLIMLRVFHGREQRLNRGGGGGPR